MSTVFLPHQKWGRPGFQLGRGRLPAGTLNKTEKAYSDHLEAKKARGDVLWYRFEALRLKLADNTFYTADFTVMVEEGYIEFHEVKGFWHDAGRIKIKVAAEQYPMFRFKAYKTRSKKAGGGWEVENF